MFYVNYKRKKTLSLNESLCLLGFVCRSINLQIFTEISRFYYISLQIFGVLRLRGLQMANSIFWELLFTFNTE